MISHSDNNKIVSITGDRTNPYTKGKLCAKGYSYIERNYHSNRIKYPYYQKVKGSGKFKPISWDKAFQLILKEMKQIYQSYECLIPIALYKYTGNIGVHHFVTEEFFSSIGATTRIVGSPCSSAGFEGIEYDLGVVQMPSPPKSRKLR